MALLEAKPASSATSVFEMGNLSTNCFQVETSDTSSPPKPLLIVTPTIEGTFPVLLFLHGFCLRNSFYTQLLQHISSHGFVVVALQLYLLIPSTGTEEVDSAAAVTNWLPLGLQSVLPQNVQANLLKLALSGHSRGGKAAFALALGYAKTSLNFSVLLGIDPVAGLGKCCQTNPKILTYVPQSFNLSIPVTVIGTGLGDEQRNCLFPPCAPDGVNHKEFFNECKPPCCHFVAKDYGHMDMLDDDPKGCIGAISGCICKNGKAPRDPMRRSVGGIVVAFLRAYVEGENGDLKAIVDEPDIAPAKLDPVEFIEA
ncbi:hypothetical protein L1049_004493 [Liquidambar formosana]|uniref:chlorophyllase n=1 Tax=Liquidambar formosana TaxID=63359 RepID=A0AAP0X0D3_LIQFO